MILLYHKIARLQSDYNLIGVTPKNFRYQMEYIRKKFDIVPLHLAREDAVTITFDDGFRDFYTEVCPYLSENNIPATLFVTTGKIGSKEELWTTELLRLIFSGNGNGLFCHLELPLFSYDFPAQSLEEKLVMYRAIRRLCMKSEAEILQSILIQLRKWADVDSRGREDYLFLTEQELQALSKNPLVTIGAHTRDHISLGAFSKAYQEKEILSSKIELERITGKEIRYFSYPFGGQYDYNEETIEILKRAGMEKAYTTLTCPGKNKMYEIPRVVMPNLGGQEFDAWFQGLIQNQPPICASCHEQEGAVEYIGRLSEDIKLLQETNKIAIFGVGIRGQKIYRTLKTHGIDTAVSCFIDNDRTKQGKCFEKKPIISVEQIQELKPETILVNSIWEKEIIEQLIRAGAEGIHWIVD